MSPMDLQRWEVALNKSLEHRDLEMMGQISHTDANSIRLDVSPIHFKLLQRVRDSCEVHGVFLERVKHQRRKFARFCALLLRGDEPNYEHHVMELTHVIHMASMPCMRTEMIELVGTRDRLSRVIATALYDEKRRRDETRALGTWEDGVRCLHAYYS